MSKPVAIRPYQSIIPFLNIEKMAISPTGVRLRMSNEILHGSSLAETKTISVGNYVMFSNNKAIIEDLNTDNQKLKDKITRDAQNRTYLTLDTSKDFGPKQQVLVGAQKHRVLQHTYEKVHILPNTLLEGDLYVLVVSYLQDPNKSTVTVGSVLKETVLLAGRPPLYGTLYSLSENMNDYGVKGNLWPASVHEHRATSFPSQAPSPMTGRTHTLAPHPKLLEDDIINVKVADLRLVAASTTALPVFDPPSGAPVLTNNENINLPKNDTAVYHDQKQVYFSQSHMSRDSNGVVYGYFAFDLHDYFKENSLFGKYIDNTAALAACMELVDIKIRRVATKKLDLGSNALTQGIPGTSLCTIQKSGADYAYIDVASLGNGAEIIKKFNNGEILGIAFRDDDAASYSAGALTYHAGVILKDKSKDALRAIYKDINTRVSKWNVNPSTGGDVVASYMASIEFIKGNAGFGDFTPAEWQRTLRVMTSKDYAPDPASPALIINSLVKGYLAALEAIFDANNIGGMSNVANFHSSISSTNSPLGLITHAELSPGLGIANMAGIGLNYIDDYLSDTGAVIPSITYATMQQRIQAEEEKFPEAAANAEPVNSFGYLTPQSVNVGPDNAVNTTSQQIDLNGRTAQFASNPPTATTQVDVAAATTQNANAAVLSSLGVAITGLPVSLNRVVAASGLVTPQTALASSVLGDSESFNLDNNTQATQGGGSNESIINTSRLKDGALSAYGGDLANQVIDNEFESFGVQTPPATTSAPNSLASATPAYAGGNLGVPPVATALNFGSQVRVEYLSGYTPVSGIGAENWTILTSNAFDQARQDNELLVCRLVQIHDSTYSPSGDNSIFTPLTTVFVIGPLRSLSVPGNFGALYRSYLDARATYNQEFDSTRGSYGLTALYSQNIPMEMQLLNAAAEVAIPPPVVTVVMAPNQTIPTVPITALPMDPQSTPTPSPPINLDRVNRQATTTAMLPTPPSTPINQNRANTQATTTAMLPTPPSTPINDNRANTQATTTAMLPPPPSAPPPSNPSVPNATTTTLAAPPPVSAPPNLGINLDQPTSMAPPNTTPTVPTTGPVGPPLFNPSTFGNFGRY